MAPWKRALTVAALLAVLACDGRQPGPLDVILRFIEAAPQEPFRRQAVVEDRPVFDWNLEPHGVVAAWLEPQPRRRITLPDAEIDLVWVGHRLNLAAAVDLDAAAVDRIDIVVESRVPGFHRTGDLAFYWAGPGENLAASRQLVISDGEALPGLRRRYRLRLAGEPGWRGRIAKLRAEWPAPQGVRFQILRLTGADETVDPERLRRFAADGIKGAIGGDIRDALPALPGAPVERRGRLPAGAELRFAYGLQPGLRRPVRFAVAVAAAGRSRRLFEATIDPAFAAPGWQPGAVDLGDYAGEEVRIVLETVAEGELDLARGLPLWGHPEVLAPPVRRQVAAPRARSAAGSVVLISLDTLRADHLSAYGYHRETSPRLDQLAADGVLFEDFVVTGGGTLPSHLSMLTSLFPATHGVTSHDGRGLPPGRVTLAETLRGAGFATAAFTDGGWMRGRFGFFQGFESFDEGGGRLAAIRPKVEAWLEGHRDRPFFLFVHSYDVHSEWDRLPYDCPSPDRDRFVAPSGAPRSGVPRSGAPGFDGCRDGKCASTLLAWANSRIQDGERAEEIFSRREIDTMEALYDGCIRYADAEVGGLIDKLRELDLYDQSLIVVTSDHGEEFAEHGRFLHSRTDYEELVKIPLILKLPGSRFRGRRVPHLAAMVDLMPTVLELMAAAPGAGIQGRSLMPAIADDLPVRRAVHIRDVLRTPRWKYLGRSSRLYDLSADPGETRDVAGESAGFDPRWKRYLERANARDRRLFEEFEAAAGEGATVTLSDEEIAQLEALGYLN